MKSLFLHLTLLITLVSTTTFSVKASNLKSNELNENQVVLQTEKGDKSAREREARLEKERAAKPTDSSQPSQDDSYYTKFMNLFK